MRVRRPRTSHSVHGRHPGVHLPHLFPASHPIKRRSRRWVHPDPRQRHMPLNPKPGRPGMQLRDNPGMRQRGGLLHALPPRNRPEEGVPGDEAVHRGPPENPEGKPTAGTRSL